MGHAAVTSTGHGGFGQGDIEDVPLCLIFVNRYLVLLVWLGRWVWQSRGTTTRCWRRLPWGAGCTIQRFLPDGRAPVCGWVPQLGVPVIAEPLWTGQNGMWLPRLVQQMESSLTLIRETCRAHHGPLASVGVLQLSADRVVFEPVGSLERLVGLPSFSLPIENIDRVELSGLDRMLAVHSGTDVWWFAGPGARRVGRRLALLLAGAGAENAQPVLVSAEARMSGQGRVDVFVTATETLLVPIRDDLDSRGTCFSRDVAVRTQGLPAGLILGTGPDAVRLSGAGVARLAAVLLLPGVQRTQPVLVEASQQSGLLAHAGLLAIGEGGVCFAPLGLLHQILGQAPTAWPWAEVVGMQSRRGGVVIDTVDGPMPCSSHDAESLWLALLASARGWMVQRVGQRRGWSSRLPSTNKGIQERVLEVVPALRQMDGETPSQRLVCGDLELTAHQITFRPSDGGTAVGLSRDKLVAGETAHTVMGPALSLLVPDGVVARWGIPARANVDQKPVGPVSFVRIMDESARPLLTSGPCELVARTDGVAVPFLGQPPSRIHPGQILRVELGKNGEKVSLKAAVVAVLGAEADRSGWRLLLDPSPHAGAHLASEQALAEPCRVTVAQVEPGGGRLISAPTEHELTRLGRGSCQLRGRVESAVGSELRLVIHLPSGPVRLFGRVRHCRRLHGRFECGVTFRGGLDADLEAIDQIIMSEAFATVREDALRSR